MVKVVHTEMHTWQTGPPGTLGGREIRVPPIASRSETLPGKYAGEHIHLRHLDRETELERLPGLESARLLVTAALPGK